MIPSDPAAQLVNRRVKTPLPRILSEAEVAQLLAATRKWSHDVDKPDARPHLLVTLLLDTGIKKGECMNIALNDVDATDPREAIVFIRYESMKQRHKERRLRLSPQFAAILPEYLTQHKPQSRLFECTARNLERAGLPPRVLSFEALRWTCAARDLKQGLDEDTLRRKLGLSRITWAETAEKLRKLTAPAL